MTAPGLPQLDVLFEEPGLPAFPLPAAIAAAYGGTLGFEEPRLFANFVSTADGVVAVPSIPSSNKLIAAGSAADRFVMGILRACADALVIGAATLTASPRSVWSPEQAFPDATSELALLQQAIGRHGPEIAVLTASGQVDPAHPCFASGALVLTTDGGSARLAGKLPEATTVVSLGEGPRLDPVRVVAALHDRGHRLLLSEGGSHSLGAFLAAGLVDELFLTVSPLLVGRTETERRLGLVEGVDLLPGVNGRLLGIRREGGHVFLRYGLDR